MALPFASAFQAGRRQRWVEGQRRRRASPLFRLLDHSFGFRLFVAGVTAVGLLAVVNRFENCHANPSDRNCLSSNVLAVISVSNVEALSIVTAALLFILEGPRRRRRENHEAMELVMACQNAGVVMSLGRIEALETLNDAGLWIDGLDLRRTHLEGLRAEHGHWHRVDLSEAQLRGCRMAGTDLSGSNLSGADLRGADLRGAVLAGVNLHGADLRDADLCHADLSNADLSQADLTGAKLTGTGLEQVEREERAPLDPAT